MGCYDVVCAFTNTPIYAGEKCHLVILPKDIKPWTMMWLCSSETWWGNDAQVFHGTYDDYGRVESKRKLTKAESELLDTFQDAFEEESFRYSFFLSDDAWQYCQKRYSTFVPNHVTSHRLMRKMSKAAGRTPPEFSTKEQKREADQIALARVLMGLVTACKHPLSGFGCYHQYDGSEGEAIREAHALAEKRLVAREKYVQEEYGEEADE
jgi:hypothetical protein